jgi:hypothetical protein
VQVGEVEQAPPLGGVDRGFEPPAAQPARRKVEQRARRCGDREAAELRDLVVRQRAVSVRDDA